MALFHESNVLTHREQNLAVGLLSLKACCTPLAFPGAPGVPCIHLVNGAEEAAVSPCIWALAGPRCEKWSCSHLCCSLRLSFCSPKLNFKSFLPAWLRLPACHGETCCTGGCLPKGTSFSHIPLSPVSDGALLPSCPLSSAAPLRTDCAELPPELSSPCLLPGLKESPPELLMGQALGSCSAGLTAINTGSSLVRARPWLLALFLALQGHGAVQPLVSTQAVITSGAGVGRQQLCPLQTHTRNYLLSWSWAHLRQFSLFLSVLGGSR